MELVSSGAHDCRRGSQFPSTGVPRKEAVTTPGPSKLSVALFVVRRPDRERERGGERWIEGEGQEIDGFQLWLRPTAAVSICSAEATFSRGEFCVSAGRIGFSSTTLIYIALMYIYIEERGLCVDSVLKPTAALSGPV